MAAIRSKDTKPELTVRKYLHKLGFRYRLHNKLLPGKPDLVLAKRKTAIFVHGCFWHGHEGCKDFRIPKTRSEWWAGKIGKNVARDIINRGKLIDIGWAVETIWECQITDNELDALAERLTRVAVLSTHPLGEGI